MPFTIDANGQMTVPAVAPGDNPTFDQWLQQQGYDLPQYSVGAQDRGELTGYSRSADADYASRAGEPGTPSGTPFLPGIRQHYDLGDLQRQYFEFLNPNFATGQQAAMAPNRWLLTTPGFGIGTQTATQRSGIRWPGTTSPGRTPQERAAAIARAQGRPNPRYADAAGNPARAPTSVRNPFRGGQTVMSPQAQQGLYPGPRGVRYVPAGVQAPVGQYTYTPTENGMTVAPPGVDADLMAAQYSSWSNVPPTIDEQTRAITEYGLA